MALGDGIRRNVATVSQEERDRLLAAIVRLQQVRVYPDGVSYWFKQDQIHQATHVHGGPAFLPWHRELCNRFEALIREVDPQLSLHYWDWTTDPRATPDGAGNPVDLFTPQFMGSAIGRAGAPFDAFDNNGVFEGSRDENEDPRLPPAVITRAIPPSAPAASAASSFQTDEEIIHSGDGLPREQQYRVMRNALEDMHNAIHGYIGGTIGSAHSSFEDPFVFLLHSNVDRLFAMWQSVPGEDWRLDRQQVYGVESVSGGLRGITSPLEPWAGDANHTGAVLRVRPWAPPEDEIVVRNSLDPSVVAPPVYDTMPAPGLGELLLAEALETNRLFKIHPAIGVARVGDHPTAFFVGPETVGSPGLEIAVDGTEAPILHYKEAGQIKRQASRFRVFEYAVDGAGRETLIGEVGPDRAAVAWTVHLVNRKAALDHSPGAGHPAFARNTGIEDRQSLIIDGRPQTVAGVDQPGVEFNGTFLGVLVHLGEIRTDRAGRLLVLGGHGVSRGIPETPGGAIPPLDEFANNDRWHDDVSDGPVTATITFPGQPPISVQQPAWVVVAPPDFAPGIGGVVTLYDVATGAAIEKGLLRSAPQPSFQQHIRPVIERAAKLRWSNDWNRWNALLPLDWNVMANPSAAAADRRKTVGKRIEAPGLRQFAMPGFLRTYFDRWIAGAFTSDLDQPVPPRSAGEELDQASLEACVGGNFYPGIEASITLRDPEVYAGPYRLDHTNHLKVYPGVLSEIMALPWQADFVECDGGAWWPSQRPDLAMLDANRVPESQASWAAPLGALDHLGMVRHWQQLGFLLPEEVGGQTVFVETERDPAFPR